MERLLVFDFNFGGIFTVSCDVCQQELGTLVDRKRELSILIKAIDELPKMGEVKMTEWIRGGQIAWVKTVAKHEVSAYSSSSAGYISRMIKPATYGQTVQGLYASLQPTE